MPLPPSPPELPGDPALWEIAEDKCERCGAHIGYGIRLLHLGICDECHDREDVDLFEEDRDEPDPAA